MDQERIIRSLKMQLLIERVVIAAIAVALAGSWGFARLRGGKSLILVDGRPVVCVPTEKEARAVLLSVKSKTGYNPNEIEFRQDVRVARAPRDANVVSRHRAIRVVEGMVSPLVPRWAVLVDGKPAVAVPSRKIAGEVLDLAKMKFGQMAKNLVEEPQFKEDVTVDIVGVDPSMYKKTAQEAVDYLFSGPQTISKDGIYVVQDGDIASNIARKVGVPLKELWALNPGMNLHKLQIGDKIRVKSCRDSHPRLTVVVRDQVERVETVPAPTLRVSSARMPQGKSVELSPGHAGQRKVKVAVIYENGRKTGSEITEEQVLQEPQPRQVAEGIR